MMKNVASEGARGEIELQGVTKLYGEDRVVDSVSATIGAGEFFSLLGPSGSGKTTTLMMIAGFAEVNGGSILVDGANIVNVPVQRRNFGMVFQNYAIFPHLNVFENIAFPLRARGMAGSEISERVKWALELVRLDSFAERFSRQLSGGQQQRVAIARAIVFHPSVVLMDEPLGALDKNLRYEMQVEIKEIQRRLGMTVVYVTHDQEEAMNMSDRIAIMNSGRIEQVGPPTGIYERPSSIFAARFLGEANLIEGLLESVVGGIASVRIDGGAVLRAETSGQPRPGGTVSVFFRPERVSIGDSRAGDQVSSMNRLQGKVVQTSFLGNILRYSVDIGNGHRVLVDLQNSRGDPVQGASEVALSWRVSDSLVLDR